MGKYIYESGGTAETAMEAVKLLKSGVPMAVFDFETTGRSTKTARVVQIGAMKASMKNGVLVAGETFKELVDPQCHIPEGASAVNGITDEMVAGCMKEEEACRAFRDFLGPRPLVCGYNSIRYDGEILDRMYLRAFGQNFSPLLHVDVMAMAKAKLVLKSYKLADVAEELGCSIGIDFHDAFGDVTATWRTFKELYPRFAERNAILPRLPVQGVFYWSRSHTLSRVYIRTYPKTDTYYDIYRKQWVSNMDIDLPRLREDALAYCRAEDEKGLIEYAKSRAT